MPGGSFSESIAALDRIPYWFIALAARIFPAAVFWQSGQTKVAGLHLKPSAIALFQNEYQLPLIDPDDRRLCVGVQPSISSRSCS